MTPRLSRPDPELRATVLSRQPLLYARGADEALDRPAHVRAGSGLAWVSARVGAKGGAKAGARLAVVQDDANFLALVDPATGRADAITLPAGHEGKRQFDEGRGTKAWKLDLEACVALDGGALLLAFGSGSAPPREQVLVVADPAGRGCAPRLVAAPRLYAGLRAERALAGTQLNLEGAAVVGPDLLLFQRGNGRPGPGVELVNATCRLDLAALRAHLDAPERAPPPPPRDVRRWDLGAFDGVRLTFTDAAVRRERGAVFYLAAAEDSPDAVRDGPVAGVALGALDPAGDGPGRFARLAGPDGGPFLAKAEGLAFDPTDARTAFVVLDADDAAVPSELCRVRLDGPWPA